jgi:RNA polymerase sigma-70 factor (ECF subfamily)
VVAALGRALDALPPRERDALRAIYMEGCATAEVAARLGVSRRAVNLICERGRRRLRELLRGFAPEAAALFG